MRDLPEDRVVELLTELKAAYAGFTWESELWRKDGARRSPYRTLVLFGLSARTKGALLVQMCRRFFDRYPNTATLAEGWEPTEGVALSLVRPGQLPFVASMALVSCDGVPRSREALLGIKGVGDKISECVLAYGWGEDALPLDANCVRVLVRVFGKESSGRAGQQPAPLREGLKYVYLRQTKRFHGLSIGMIDIHEILRLHGQVCCTRVPDCARCPVSGCLSRRTPWDGPREVRAVPEIWDDWRELINEPAAV